MTTTTTTTQVLAPAPCDDDEVRRLLDKYPIGQIDYNYGTAGFRYDATLLPPVMVRVGLAACLRSVQCQHQAVGVMITASHNDATYNGVKLADPDGGMIDTGQGEKLVVDLVNERSVERTCQKLKQLLMMASTSSANNDTDVDLPRSPCSSAPFATVHIGRDTRDHSPALACLVMRASRALGATVVDHGVITTPMLHWAVLQHNPHHLPLLITPPRPSYATLTGYYDLLVDSYLALLLRTSITTSNDDVTSSSWTAGTATTTTLPSRRRPLLVVDCACGVGYPHLRAMQQQLQQKTVAMPTPMHATTTTASTTVIVATNAPGSGPLNEGCGSEHVQKQLQPPRWYQQEELALMTEMDDLNVPSSNDMPPNLQYCASLDGDADRIVFFACEDNNNNNDNNKLVRLLDGDKIACLVCDFLQSQLSILRQALPDMPPLELGVVQTAYANGASTQYLQRVLNNNNNVCIAKTGVKHVHAAAHKFDIGVYFEANGHGTILFGPQFYNVMAFCKSKLQGIQSAASTALQRLVVLPSLVNQAVGDALSDLLLVDAILSINKWSLAEWDAMYQDLPSRQCKVRVKDRSIIRVNENETKCLEPPAVQVELDAAMQALQGRAFVRPSGTEDVVRVYAEASTREAADQLASRAAEIVHRNCDGVDDDVPPVFPTSRI